MQRSESASGKSELDILLVEDNRSDIVLFKHVLRSSGIPYSLKAASDGAEALSILSHYRPHVVFLDLNLPCRNGAEVLALMKGDPALCDIPVVILTGSDDAEDRAVCNFLGAALFLHKAAAVEDFFQLAASIHTFLNSLRPVNVAA